MDLLLFIGGEFLRKMTDPAVGADERESLRYDLSAYCEQDDGADLAIVDAFNRLDFEDYLTFDRDTMIWYLDWVSSERPNLMRRVETASVAALWSAFNEPVVRTRAVEVLIDIESAGEVSPSQSQIVTLVERVVASNEKDEAEPVDSAVSSDVESILSQLAHTLLTDQRAFGLRVLGEALARIPVRYQQRVEDEIDRRLATLSDDRARGLRNEIQRRRRSGPQ